MPQLTDRCDIWRMVGTYDGGKTLKAVYSSVPCLRVPISSFDNLPAYARESTDVFMVPDWLPILKDDELRKGRRADVAGNTLQFRFTVDGIRQFDRIGFQHVEVFARSRD